MNKIKKSYILSFIIIFIIIWYWGLFDKKLNGYFPINPQKGKSVIISSNVPANSKPIILANYISKKCSTLRFNSNFMPAGINYWTSVVEWNVNEDKNKSETEIPVDGGGWCDWKLDYININLVYTEKTETNKLTDKYKILNNSISLDASKGLTVTIKDQKKSSVKLKNEIKYNKKFYLVQKEFISTGLVSFFLISPSNEDEFEISLEKDTNGYIYYTPKLNESNITKLFVSKDKYWFEYPDGQLEHNIHRIDYDKIDQFKK
ncbi:hypothetical protein KKI93_14100 [Xenorhabdus bovienii]|uniref:hypothetical protein n=1 Tax=Xenorhabdus bovienii TaxID=40576 RepID=UPI0023B35216|nr:hypothetical protein [Xenorhabdus bovienii]MDE9565161.1 hypothetical protein [Xenorhabdus bovienii]